MPKTSSVMDQSLSHLFEHMNMPPSINEQMMLCKHFCNVCITHRVKGYSGSL